MEAEAGRSGKWAVGIGVYVLALASILYPAYGPGSYVRQGLGTSNEVLVYAAVSFVIALILFGTNLLARPLWALVAAVLGLAGGLGGAEYMGVPVVLGAAAAYFASRTRREGPGQRLATAAFIVGLLAVIATIAVVVFEPLTD